VVESSAARPRLRGGRRGGEKFGPGSFATLERRGPKGQADEPIFVASDLKRQIRALVVSP